MIERAEFVLLVRCDSLDCPTLIGESREAEFYGETRAHAIREARAAGWLVGSSRVVANLAYCPTCRDRAPKQWKRGFKNSV